MDACPTVFKRVRADYDRHQRSVTKLERAQSRRNRLLVYGRHPTKLGKAQRKADAAIKAAISELKTTYARFERSEKAWIACNRRKGV